MADIFADLRTVHASSVPIAAELCRMGKISETINHMVNWKEENSKISPGLLIESLVNMYPLWPQTLMESGTVLGRQGFGEPHPPTSTFFRCQVCSF
ncbi:MAG: hypothetical protein ACYC2T_07515 [Bacillota bacterium]